jgi:hypothetical protein
VGIFKDESGNSTDAQLLAFEDTWHWKPLHDLISRVQKSKDNAGDPPETTGR